MGVKLFCEGFRDPAWMKRRVLLEQRRDRVQRWTASAPKRAAQASRRADRRYAERKQQVMWSRFNG